MFSLTLFVENDKKWIPLKEIALNTIRSEDDLLRYMQGFSSHLLDRMNVSI